MKILRKKEYDDMLEKIEDLNELINMLTIRLEKVNGIIGALHAIFKYYRNNKCGATKLITNVSYVLGLGDIPDKYKILRKKNDDK